jgi:membrane fusion protein, adhesin transport system
MLNISKNNIKGLIDTEKYKSFKMLTDYRASKVFKRLLTSVLIILFLMMFVPWTQNIRAIGYVTSLQPEQRPQTIHSIIPGRIEKWYVAEGDYVKKGDTVLFISEVKDEYFDPELLSRTESQIQAKGMSVKSYMEKVIALDNQIDALNKTQKLKLEQGYNYIKQATLKVQSDSIDLEAAKINFEIAEKQISRIEQLYNEGLKSLTELETQKLKLQENFAKLISAENKLLTSRNELINAMVEINSIENQYRDKLSKAESEKYSALSAMYDSEALVTKMQNQFMNYTIRAGMYFITAPQDGYITQAIRTGLGETVKEGEELISIMPSNFDYAVEMYMKPMDMPLLKLGKKVRFIFDGWPAIVFSGWPDMSYGTFGGRIVAIDNFISSNGKYRILVAPDKEDVEWPKELRIGSGATGMALLNDVPIWYELWRQLNGFPPDYYAKGEAPPMIKKKKDAKNEK